MLLPPQPITNSQYLTNKDHKSTEKKFQGGFAALTGKNQADTDTPLPSLQPTER